MSAGGGEGRGRRRRNAYVYFSRLFSDVEPDIAIIVADAADWPGRGHRTGCRSSETMPVRSVPASW